MRLRIFIGLLLLLGLLLPTLNAASQTTGMVIPGGAMNVPRAGHGATLLPDGTVLITGGFKGDGRAPMNTAEIYDPATGTFTLVAPMNRVRAYHAAILLPNGLVLVAGGASANTWITDADLYDPATKTFTAIAPMNFARGNFTATALQDGRVLFVGGILGRNYAMQAEIFDPATNLFIPVGNLNVARAHHTATLLNDGRILIAGGLTAAQGAQRILNSAELYDPVTGSFTLVPNPMNQRRHKHASVLLSDGTVLLAGGADYRDARGGQLSNAEVFDPPTGMFYPVNDMSAPRFKIVNAVVRLSNGGAIIAGGGDTVEVYSPQSFGFALANGGLDSLREYGTATLLADGSVLIVGGYDKDIESTASVWLYRP